MDTRFWGPDGWNLLHSITANYPETPDESTRLLYEEFFQTLSLLLPCIYCRKSFIQYMEELPISNFLQNQTRLSYWLYLMHNKVNNKLDKQGFPVNYNNNFPQINQSYQRLVDEFNNYYQTKLRKRSTQQQPIWGNLNQWKVASPFPGMLFIYSILFNYPTDPNFKHQQQRRYYAYLRFFYLLERVIPFNPVKKALQYLLRQYSIENNLNPDSLKKLGYVLETLFCEEVKLTKCPTFQSRVKLIERFRAGCTGKNDKIPTCHSPGGRPVPL